MDFMPIDCTSTFTAFYEDPIQEAKPKKRRAKGKEFSWAPELKTNKEITGLYTGPLAFAISDLIKVIFSHLSVSDVCAFERVCKYHRHLTPDLWHIFREQQGFLYNWKICSQVQFEDKANYILSKFLFEYMSSLHREQPLKKLESQRMVVEQLFPLFKTFYEAVEIVKSGYKSLRKFEDVLEKEPILHAAIRIYRCVYGELQSSNPCIPFFSPAVSITAKAISEGATCLGRLAVIVCNHHHQNIGVIKNRYLPFLRSVTLQAKNQRDASGQQLLAGIVDGYIINPGRFSNYVCDIKLFSLVYKQFYSELSEDDRLSEEKLLSKFEAQLAAGQVSDKLLSLLMRLYIQLEQYTRAEHLADVLQKLRTPIQFDYMYMIILKIRLKKFDEVNELYNKLLYRKTGTFNKNCSFIEDISFLLGFSRFKCQYKGGDPKVADDLLMRYWNGGMWHTALVFNYANKQIKIQTAEDYQSEAFIKLLEVIIQVKSDLKQEADVQWFRTLRAVTLVDLQDPQACLQLKNRLFGQHFYSHPHMNTLPRLLLEKNAYLAIQISKLT